ncbi:MAG: AAA family ATPase [Chitinophagaceae bacterium]
MSRLHPLAERFNLQPQKLNNQAIQLEWIEKGNPEQYFTSRHLSDGTIRFVALTTLLLQPELPKTIIIDEPELGLHPVAINKLSGMLQSAERARGYQIIIFRRNQ